MSADPAGDLRGELKALYRRVSKHSAYQSIPDFVSAELGYSEEIQVRWRDDHNRLQYIESGLAPRVGERWIDFGANTGYFTFTLAKRYPASEFVAIEANPDHAEFLRKVRQTFNLRNVEVVEGSIGFDELSQLGRADVMLHLNVLHHAGADFDSGMVVDADSFVAYARSYLAQLRRQTSAVVLQVGSNLWGDKARPIVPRDDDVGKARLFGSLALDAGWNLRRMAFAAIARTGSIDYCDLSKSALRQLASVRSEAPGALDREIADLHLERHIGEFFRRPILVLGGSAAE